MKKKSVYVIMHNIRSCYNIGSLFRTSDALGIEKVFLGGYSPRPDQNKSISKTALGAEKCVEWEAHWHTHAIIDKLKADGVRIVALEQAEKSIDLNQYQPIFPMAILVGNEVKGLSRSILSRVHDIVEIPMKGEKESLNVSVAFGIAAYTLIMEE
ncbi:MAG: TrmH family RNA methyltransferase [Patescibacteria group bacterium]|nr:TrmH family RNA methyltransferase [Patescibacteria group bacterium]